jgi:hypothetical protein
MEKGRSPIRSIRKEETGFVDQNPMRCFFESEGQNMFLLLEERSSSKNTLNDSGLEWFMLWFQCFLIVFRVSFFAAVFRRKIAKNADLQIVVMHICVLDV